MTHILFHLCWTYSAAQRTVSPQFSVLEYPLSLVWFQGFQTMYWPYQSDTEISLGGCWATSMEMILMILSSAMVLCWETMHLTLKSTSSDSHVSKLHNSVSLHTYFTYCLQQAPNLPTPIVYAVSYILSVLYTYTQGSCNQMKVCSSTQLDKQPMTMHIEIMCQCFYKI